MSIASSQPIETRRRPPFYGPDQRYVPPTENGVALPDPLPGHLELPDENDEIVENFRETPQNVLLDQAHLAHPRAAPSRPPFCHRPRLWNLLEARQPARARRGLPRLVLRTRRSSRSRRALSPLVRPLEGACQASGPHRVLLGRWNERARPHSLRREVLDLRAGRPGGYYAIFVVETGELEVHRLQKGRYRRMAPNKRGHYPIEPLGVDLGVWHGLFYNETAPWLRWYDTQGNLLPISDERAEAARRKADEERRKADEERRKADEERRKAEEERRKAEDAVRMPRTSNAGPNSSPPSCASWE